MAKIAAAIEGEFRGYKEPYTYTHRQSGEDRTAAGKLQFVCSAPDGTVEVIEVSQTQWERANAPQVSQLTAGDKFVIRGYAAIPDDRPGYFVCQSVEPV